MSNDNLGILLIHSDTTDGSTTFTDSSDSAHTITASSCTHEDTTSKFGDTSIYFSGSGGLNLPTSGDFAFDGDFTIDFWVYPTGGGSFGLINYSSGNKFHALYLDSTTSGRVLINGANNITGIVLTASTWQHYALVREGTSIKAYINGAQSGTTGTISGTVGASTVNTVGYDSAGHNAHGYIDEFRVVKGEAIWTSSFTPPTDIYTGWDGIVTSPEISIPITVSSKVGIQLLHPDTGLAFSVSEPTIFTGLNLESPSIEIPIIATPPVVQLGILSTVVESVISCESPGVQINLLTPEVETNLSIENPIIFTGFFIEHPETSIPIIVSCGINFFIESPDIDLFFNFETPTIQIGIAQSEIGIDVIVSSGNVKVFETDYAEIYYFLDIAGIEIPLSSFQCVRRSDAATYLQVVIPSLDNADYISENASSDMNLSMGFYLLGEELRREKILSTSIDTIRIDQGPISQSITLSGYVTESNTAKTVMLTGETYKTFSNGIRRSRFARPNIDLNPGDTVIIGDDSFVADSISYYFGAKKGGINQNMEVAEAAA